MPIWINLTMIGLAGAAGALFRYGISVWLKQLAGDGFPYGTLVVNIVGCLLLGMMSTMLDEITHKDLRAILGVGFLGALTTFSTFGVETINRVQQGQLTIAGANIAANLVLGLACAGLGIYLGRLISGTNA